MPPGEPGDQPPEDDQQQQEQDQQKGRVIGQVLGRFRRQVVEGSDRICQVSDRRSGELSGRQLRRPTRRVQHRCRLADRQREGHQHAGDDPGNGRLQHDLAQGQGDRSPSLRRCSAHASARSSRDARRRWRVSVLGTCISNCLQFLIYPLIHSCWSHHDRPETCQDRTSMRHIKPSGHR